MSRQRYGDLKRVSIEEVVKVCKVICEKGSIV